MKRRLFYLAVILFGLATGDAQTKSDEATVRRIPQAFVVAWATHDGHRLARLMSDDVDFVNVGGDWLHGRPDFELYHTRYSLGSSSDLL